MRLSVCYPAYRSQVHAGHMFQLASLHRLSGPENQLDVGWVDCCFLDLARNHLLHAALGREAHWALMCDADTYIMDGKPIVNMINTGEEIGAAVIAAPVRLRGRPSFNAQIGKDYIEKNPGTIQKVDRIGTAFMAINCRWLQANWPKHPWFESRIIEAPDGSGRPDKMSEDFEFCDGVTRRGGTVYMDGRFEPAHAGITTETMTWVGVETSPV